MLFNNLHTHLYVFSAISKSRLWWCCDNNKLLKCTESSQLVKTGSVCAEQKLLSEIKPKTPVPTSAHLHPPAHPPVIAGQSAPLCQTTDHRREVTGGDGENQTHAMSLQPLSELIKYSCRKRPQMPLREIMDGHTALLDCFSDHGPVVHLQCIKLFQI